jgi:plasmid stabilization system protein ParE
MRILWSDLAKAQLREIYRYYKEVAGVKVARSIKNKIIKKSYLLIRQPALGQLEDNPLVANLRYRYLVEGNYKIVYKIFDEKKEILISTVFDTRQNPTKLSV